MPDERTFLSLFSGIQSAEWTSDSNEPDGDASDNASLTPTDEVSSNDGGRECPDGPMSAPSVAGTLNKMGVATGRFLEQDVHLILTSSAAGSPASRSPSPASAAPKTTTATSGRSSSASSRRSGPHGSSLRTSQVSPWMSGSTRPVTDAYAAGLIDGEGCLYLHKTSLGARLQVNMAAKGLSVLRGLEATYGGGVRKHREETERWAAVWSWLLNGADCVKALRTIQPLLMLKGRQAALIIDLYDRLKPGRGRDWEPTKRAEAEAMRLEIQRLNRTGPEPLPEGAFARLVDGRWVTAQTELLSDLGYETYSGVWPSSGMVLRGAAWTVATSESPRDAVVTSLSDILEPSVPSRFYLSSKAARGILRRAAKRGRELPSHLSAALEAVARTTTTDKAGDS